MREQPLTIKEPAKELAVIHTTDVLVIGSGPAGLAAAIAAAAREVAGTIEIIGAGAGIAMPFLPLPIEFRATFFYVLCVLLAVMAHFVKIL